MKKLYNNKGIMKQDQDQDVEIFYTNAIFQFNPFAKIEHYCYYELPIVF